MKHRPSPKDFNAFKDEYETIEVTIYKEYLDNQYENTYLKDYKLNPQYFKAIVRDVSPETLTWQLFGLKEKGAKEILTDIRNISLIKQASVLKIRGEEYVLYREANSKRASITTRNKDIVVILEKK